MPAWWQNGTIYHVYPRSFQDSNGDGIGDLNGIRLRLDYFCWLGIDAIWISPIYPSPMQDFGYDVADYCNIDPIFGNLDSFDALIAEAHALGLKIILDFVPNHTSALHPWFLASRSSRDDPKRDWYIWRDPAKDGGPPNNWLSHFGGNAWTFVAHTGQYFYHAYLADQPDLNWRNPEVRAAMHDVMRFWLRRGVDGFRVDVLWHLIKDAAFRDNPPNPAWTAKLPEIDRLLPLHSADQPEVHDVIAGMRHVVDEFKDRVLIGEIYLPLERLIAYYGENLAGAHLPLNFQLLETPWSAKNLADLITRYEGALPEGAWPNWVLSNHDRPRVAARIGEKKGRVAAMLLLTLRGTPTLYYGDELGLGHVPVPAHLALDPWGKREPGLNVGRDSSRTPMQWDESEFAGFSTHTPWLPLTDDHTSRNVAALSRKDASILALVRTLLAFRRRHSALASGSFHLIEAGEQILCYERHCGQNRVLVALNLGSAPENIRALPAPSRWRIVLSSAYDRSGELASEALALSPDEGLLLEPA
jgi:alpha-glucosidase